MVGFEEDVIDQVLYEELEAQFRAMMSVNPIFGDASGLEEDEDGFVTNFNYAAIRRYEPKCTCGAAKLGYALDNFKAHYDWCEVHIVNRKANDPGF